jgi:plasmid maintenance system antidote protein VapI
MMKATKSERPIVRALRKAIKADPRTITRLADEAGIPVPVLSRFVQRERGMTLDSAAALAEALGLELTRGVTTERGRR